MSFDSIQIILIVLFFIVLSPLKTPYSLVKEDFSKSASPSSIKSQPNHRCSSTSGYRLTDSRNSNVGRNSASTNRSWEPSTGSEEIGGSSSYSLRVANQLSNDYKSSNSSSNLNRDDTSPLGGPSTSDDISLVRGNSKEENRDSYERQSIKDRIQKLNLQSNSSNYQHINTSNKSSISTSQTTTSGSFSLKDDLSSENAKQGILNSESHPLLSQKSNIYDCNPNIRITINYFFSLC